MAINNVGNNNVNKPQVDNQKLNQQQQAQNQASVQRGTQQAQQAAAAPRQDSVSLTQSAQKLSNVQKKGEGAPVNQEKVEKLKKAIQNGEYNVDPVKLAKNIAKFEGELFGIK